jgi:hypothetical protein
MIRLLRRQNGRNSWGGLHETQSPSVDAFSVRPYGGFALERPRFCTESGRAADAAAAPGWPMLVPTCRRASSVAIMIDGSNNRGKTGVDRRPVRSQGRRPHHLPLDDPSGPGGKRPPRSTRPRRRRSCSPDIPGAYVLQLVVTDSNGCQGSAPDAGSRADRVRGRGAPPNPEGGAGADVRAGTPITLDASRTADPEGGPDHVSLVARLQTEEAGSPMPHSSADSATPVFTLTSRELRAAAPGERRAIQLRDPRRHRSGREEPPAIRGCRPGSARPPGRSRPALRVRKRELLLDLPGATGGKRTDERGDPGRGQRGRGVYAGLRRDLHPAPHGDRRARRRRRQRGDPRQGEPGAPRGRR